MITYVKGNLFDNLQDGEINIILHIVNDRGAWGSGFVLAINKYLGLEPKKRYLESKPLLGEINTVKVTENIYVVNMCGQSQPGGVRIHLESPSKYIDIPPIRYECLRECLYRVRSILSQSYFVNKKINLIGPKFGAGLAGGDWNKIEEIINEVGLDITIYEL